MPVSEPPVLRAPRTGPTGVRASGRFPAWVPPPRLPLAALYQLPGSPLTQRRLSGPDPQSYRATARATAEPSFGASDTAAIGRLCPFPVAVRNAKAWAVSRLGAQEHRDDLPYLREND